MALISIYKKLGRTDLEEFEKKVLNTLLEEDINIKQPINEKN
jgi:hypothetical protein